MEGWYQRSSLGPAAKGAHWITFIVLVGCTMFLFRDSWKAKGPSGKERFFAGYHEEYNISLFVNLFAMIAYFGKVVADTTDHNYVNVGPLIIGLGNYRYADYMLTCPLLAYDLLSQVRAPYKLTGAILIFTVLMTGAATNFYPGKEMRAGALAWFSFGCALYMWAYWLFFSVVRTQYERLMAMAHDTDAKKAFLPLRLAVYTFFTIWIVFPVIWLLGEQGLGILSDEVIEVLHCLCDLTAKSFYGFALARYRSYFDKKLFAVLQDLGYDGEEELAHLEHDLKSMDKPQLNSTLGYPRRPSIDRHGNRRPSGEFSSFPAWTGTKRPEEDMLPNTSMGTPMAPRRFSQVNTKRLSSYHDTDCQAPLSRDNAYLPRHLPMQAATAAPKAGFSVDQLKAQLEIINMQLRAAESQSEMSADKPSDRDVHSDGMRKATRKSSHHKMHSMGTSLSVVPLKFDQDHSSDSEIQMNDRRHPVLAPGSYDRHRNRSRGRSPSDEGRGLC